MPDRENTYVVSLIVKDGVIDIVADTVTITALAPAGIWGPAVTIYSGTGFAMWPNLAMDASGTAVVVWIQENGVRSSRYVPWTGWGVGTLIETGVDNADGPKVDLSRNGTAITVWRYWKSPNSQWNGSVYANRYEPGTGWGIETRIDAALGDAINLVATIDSA